MARLPKPGEDNGRWGGILNEFLTTIHNADGSLKDNSVTAAALAPSAVRAENMVASGGSNGQVLTKDNTISGGMAWRTPGGNGTVPDATALVKGVVQLAGDLSGTAEAPTVPGLASKVDNAKLGVANGVATLGSDGKLSSGQVPATSSGVTSVAGRTGDVVLTKADVGLSNVDNTADTAKPISTATQAALDTKVDKTSIKPVATSGAYADLTGTPTIPAAQVSSDWTATTGVAQILNKPTISGTNTGDQTLTLSNQTLSISGGNSVTLPATTGVTSPLTTKGDIWVYDGTANQRLAVGTANGQLLSVDSTAATGLKWVPAPTGGTSAAWNIRTNVTTATVVAADNDWIVAVPSANSINVQLPAPVANARVRVKRAYGPGNGIQITTPNGGILDGGEVTMSTLNGGWSSQNYESDGVNWYSV